jgi:hypothetical protein
MGDEADYLIEQGMSDWGEGLDRDGYWRLFGNTSTTPRTIICKYCKQSGFYWETTPNGWRLFNREGMHYCKEKVNEK